MSNHFPFCGIAALAAPAVAALVLLTPAQILPAREGEIDATYAELVRRLE